jgi:hypothetical protein
MPRLRRLGTLDRLRTLASVALFSFIGLLRSSFLAPGPRITSDLL